MQAAEHPGGDAALHPRDILLRDTFTLGEAILYGALLFFGIISAWLGQSNYLLLGGCFIIAAILSPFLLRVFELSHPFFVERLYSSVLFLTIPLIASLVIFFIGMLQAGTAPLSLEEGEYILRQDGTPFLPSTTTAGENWFSLATFISLYLVAMFAYFVPKSRSFSERLLPWLCLNAVTVAIVGLVVEVVAGGSSGNRAFALYTRGDDWAAFALLWIIVCFAQALRVLRNSKDPSFIRTSSTWYIGGAYVLGISVMVMKPSLTSGSVLLALSILAGATASTFLQREQDPHRFTLATVASLAALVTGITGLFFLAEGTTPAIGALRDGIWQAFLDRPFFGWGMNSLGNVLPFYLSDWHPNALSHDSPPGFLVLLAEHGIVGLLLFAFIIVYLLKLHFADEHDFPFSRHLLVGCLAVIALLLFSSPLRSPSVTFNLLLVFFTSLRWAEVSRKKPDDKEGNVQLVTPASKRRVPFYTGPVKDTFK